MRFTNSDPSFLIGLTTQVCSNHWNETALLFTSKLFAASCISRFTATSFSPQWGSPGLASLQMLFKCSFELPIVTTSMQEGPEGHLQLLWEQTTSCKSMSDPSSTLLQPLYLQLKGSKPIKFLAMREVRLGPGTQDIFFQDNACYSNHTWYDPPGRRWLDSFSTPLDKLNSWALL